MIHKILHNFDWVFWLYVLNFVMVGIDFCLMLRYTKLDAFRNLRQQARKRRSQKKAMP